MIIMMFDVVLCLLLFMLSWTSIYCVKCINKSAEWIMSQTVTKILQNITISSNMMILNYISILTTISGN